MAITPTSDDPATRPSASRAEFRSARRDLRSSMVGLDHSSIMGVELMAAFLTWGGIGWLVDDRFGTGPWGIVLGALIGMAAGLYLIYLRADRMEGYEALSSRTAGARGDDGR